MLNRLHVTAGGVLFTSLLSVWVLSFFYTHTALNEVTWCLWKQATGLDCAGCGLTRSFCTMSALNPVGAFQAHPVGPFLYAAMAWYVTIHVIRFVAGNPDLLVIPSRALKVYWVLVTLIFAAHLCQTLLGWA